ncbi:unnamed protein product [Chironomus riparius]|uniref:Odorant receptor n=1 Tax=Chironomus riparius TaxID=315576 RepID=A0A9N9RWQ1_9DIPT|nr:unnamed protein product [Chironomus riparius]
MISRILRKIKFILNKISEAEVEDEFRLQQKLMKFLGIYQSPIKKPDYCSFIIKIAFLLVGFYGFGQFIRENFRNIIKVSPCLGPVLSLTMATIKFITFFFSSEKFYWIRNKIQMLNERCKDNDLDVKVIKNVRKMHSRLLIPIYCVIINVLLSAIVRPIIQNLISLCFYGQVSLTLPLKMSYNNTSVPALYILVYVFQVVLILTVLLFNVLVDLTFFTCCLYICGHFEILRKTVNTRELKKFVDSHREIIEVATKLSKLYWPVVLIQFSMMALIFCIAAIQIIIIPEVSQKITAGTHLIGGTVALFTYSYGSQKVMDSALSVGDDIYQIDKNYLFILMRTQRLLKIKAGFIHACLPTFLMLLSWTVSLVTLIESFV